MGWVTDRKTTENNKNNNKKKGEERVSLEVAHHASDSHLINALKI